MGFPYSNGSPATLADGFQRVSVISGRDQPTAVRFAPNGHVFIAEKSGLLWVYDSVDDSTGTLVIDMRAQTYNFWDRGFLGLAVSPGYPADGRLYVLYAHDAFANGNGPRWGRGGDDPSTSDPCPSPPGATDGGCVVYGRLSRIDVNTSTMQGSETPLIEGNWCQQYPSHSVGDLVFGEDGYLYVSAGEGASFTFGDWGQRGDPVNPCDDPPDGIGGPNTGAAAEGGALRAQDILSPGDPTAFGGAILRIDVSAGVPDVPPDNPLVGNGQADDDYVIAIGLRNPFRISTRPGTEEIWITDVGWSRWEEINRIPSPLAPVEDFGWPCYEGDNDGSAKLGAYASQDLCKTLYDDTPTGIRVLAPHYAYPHGSQVVAGEGCSLGDSSVTGLAFNTGSRYPPEYAGALFFADSSRRCVWTMFAAGDGVPDSSRIESLVIDSGRAVDLQIGPDGYLYYLDFNAGRVFRLEHLSSFNSPPTAVLLANPTDGPAPLTVQFDASGSSDPEDGTNLTYGWDLNGDGAFGDSSELSPQWTYAEPGTTTVELRVTDRDGAAETVQTVITAGNTPPQPTLLMPSPSKTWTVGEIVAFSGQATDLQDGSLPASQFTWDLLLHHCFASDDCHTHEVTSFEGVDSGSFEAPDHEFPSFLELRLTVEDLTATPLSAVASVMIHPETVVMRVTSEPEGLDLTLSSETHATPFEQELAIGSVVSVVAPLEQPLGGVPYRFVSWSDGGAAAHDLTIRSADITLTAVYEDANQAPMVSIIDPLRGASFVGPQDIAIIVDAVDADGSMARVDLFVDGMLTGSRNSPPWEFVWAAPEGMHALVVSGVDNLGKSSLSSPVTVTVEQSPDGDSDGDGMPNAWENMNALDSRDPADASGDLDADGLVNRDEFLNRTDPGNPDSDDDGRLDGQEVAVGTDPNDPLDPSRARRANQGGGGGGAIGLEWLLLAVAVLCSRRRSGSQAESIAPRCRPARARF